MGSTKTVNTILLGAKILQVVAGGVSRLEDIYQQVGLSKSTAHRILKSLAQTGFAYRDPVTRTYHIGPLFLQLSVNPLVLHRLLIVCAADELRHLQETSRETSLLLIPLGDQRLVLKECPSSEGISLSHGEGSTMHIAVGSAGRVLLSQYDDQILQQFFTVLDMPPIAPKFMSDPDLRMKEINTIRRRGYALTTGERFPDSAGISVPVKGYVCPVALCVFGPKFRYNPLDTLNEIRASAERISAKLKSVITETSLISDMKTMRREI